MDEIGPWEGLELAVPYNTISMMEHMVSASPNVTNEILPTARRILTCDSLLERACKDKENLTEKRVISRAVIEYEESQWPVFTMQVTVLCFEHSCEYRILTMGVMVNLILGSSYRSDYLSIAT